MIANVKSRISIVVAVSAAGLLAVWWLRSVTKIVSLLLVCSVLVACGDIIPASLKLSVVNDEGKPVADANVSGGWSTGFSNDEQNLFVGKTDSNGVYSVRGKVLDDIYVGVAKDGYYDVCLQQPHPFTAGQPGIKQWDLQTTLVLKRIRHPIPMYVQEVVDHGMAMRSAPGKYNLSSQASYDFLQGDFLPPRGNGQGLQADLEWKWQMTIYSWEKHGVPDCYDIFQEMRFPRLGDGICRGEPDENPETHRGSKFISAYEAPRDGYTNVINFSRICTGRKTDRRVDRNDDQHELYYFRIRSLSDANGMVTNAMYGKIYGQINGRFIYYLNPTPNDRNVEAAPGKNLFPKDKEPKYLRQHFPFAP